MHAAGRSLRRAPAAVRAAQAFLALAVLVMTLAWSAATAGAQDATTTTTTVPVAGVPAPDIVPKPNSGRPPQSATDPGGWAQYAVMFGIIGGLVIIVLLVRRESRKKRPQRPTPQA